MAPKVALISTLETKGVETEYLACRLRAHGLEVHGIDISLRTGLRLADTKIEAMAIAVERAMADLQMLHRDGLGVAVGIGGGTGGELILRAMQALPATFPKIVASPLPADPRMAVADTSIILVPTLSDVAGINALSRTIFETVAAMAAGVCRRVERPKQSIGRRSVGITALGSTEATLLNLRPLIEADGDEVTVFHANGYGGAAFARCAAGGEFDAVIDMTPHELTRFMLGGAHVPMPTRFSAAIDAGHCPVVLPGALNFVGLGTPEEVPERFRGRPQYRHSGQFTHVQVTLDEMRDLARALVTHLNAAGAATLIVPMGGFSHQDCPGGAIEAPNLREVFLKTARDSAAPAITIIETPHHIGDPETAAQIKTALDIILPPKEATHHA